MRTDNLPNNRIALRSVFWIVTLVCLALAGATGYAKTPTSRVVRAEGELEIIYQDSRGHSELRYFLRTSAKKLELKFAKNPPQTLRTGMHVSVKGLKVGETLELNSGESVTVGSTQVQVSGDTMGQHHVLVILVNFQDKRTQPFTREQAQSVMFTTTNDYFREVSYGQTSLTGDVYGWYTIPINSTTCDTTSIATYAQQQAVAAGANLAAYEHLVYAFPQNACTWQGRGSVGGNPSQAWINEWFELGIVGHELGHNFGLYHSRSMDCGSVSIGGSCTTDEYGDVFDLMGGANSAHFNLFQKERLGWINSGTNPPISTVSTSGTYWLESVEVNTFNPKGLKILKSTDPVTGAKTWYYVERRASIGFDNFLTGNANVLNGVIIRTGSESSGQDTYLLDMTPESTSWYDPAVVMGQSFTDTSAGVTITPISVDANGALVDVSFAAQPCVRGNPTLTFSPAQSPWMSSGATTTFNISVTNNDGNGCVASTFNSQASVPAGWSATGLPLTSISPGATMNFTLQVTSPVGAVDGFYSIGVNTVNGASPANSASAQATYSLVSKLTVTNVATQATYSRNQTATVNATVTAPGTILSGVPVTFTMTKSNGTTVVSTATTGANGVAVFKYLFNRKKDPAGTYQVRAQASANGVSGSGIVSFNVK